MGAGADGVSVKAGDVPLRELHDKNTKVARDMRDNTGQEGAAAIERSKAQIVKPHGVEKENEERPERLGVEGDRELMPRRVILPFEVVVEMEESEKHGKTHDARPQHSRAPFVDEEKSAENQLLDEAGRDHGEKHNGGDVRLLRADAEGVFARRFNGHEEQRADNPEDQKKAGRGHGAGEGIGARSGFSLRAIVVEPQLENIGRDGKKNKDQKGTIEHGKWVRAWERKWQADAFGFSFRSPWINLASFMIIRTTAYPRAGLIGNPSDGYFGKTIAFAFRNFSAKIILYESPDLEILPSRRDHSVFRGIEGLAEDVKRHGYYGGFRLLKATIKRFYDYCQEREIEIDNRNFTLRYTSDVPNRVGLAGSSAIITACMRALMSFYHVAISRHTLANLVLSVETQELAIPAGLQDRVAQAYQGLVYMDFDRSLMDSRGYGAYENLDSSLLPKLYIAYREDLSEGTEVYHNDLRSRWKAGNKEVVEAMEFWADLTVRFREALLAGDHAKMPALLDANFDKRASLYDVGDGNRDLVRTARRQGASAKFCGSGGAIVGTYEDDAMFERLEKAFAPKGVGVLKPDHAPVFPGETTAPVA